jgi:hypothetical protein
MTNNIGVGRPKIQYDLDEIKEIIDLKLLSIGNDISKLTYNSVYKFNQYLVNNKKRNSKNEIFTLYGYSFWATEYKGIPYYGKEQIDLYKQHSNIIIAGKVFEAGIDDIETIIDNNLNDPQKMKKILIKIFLNERKSNARNDIKFNEMQQEINQYKEQIKQYKEAIFMMFYNSRYSDNSLNDVITLKKEGDTYIQKELLRIFEDNPALIDEVACSSENTKLKELNNNLNDNILDMAKILSKKDNEKFKKKKYKRYQKLFTRKRYLY